MIHILLILSFLLHPFFVSVTTFNQNPKTKTVEISAKIFYNDLEQDIFKQSNVKIDIVHPKNKSESDNLIALYLQKHLKVTINNKIYPINFIGYQIIDDAAWCYLETPKTPKIKTISITNNILLALHPQQINIVNLKIDDKEASYKLDESQTVFNFINQ